uniref:hypothetical protein n=1 Tax=Algoriphagus sp. TaxID=1872435 RepID=UPI004047B17C
MLNQPTITRSAAVISVVIGQLAGQVIHPYPTEDWRKKLKNPTDIRQTGLPLSIFNSLSASDGLLYFGGITQSILVTKKKIQKS